MEKQTNDKKYAEAKALVKKGMAVQAACDQVKMHKSNYYTRSARDGKKARRGAVPVAIPEAPASQMIMIVGSPSQIAEAARKFL